MEIVNNFETWKRKKKFTVIQSLEKQKKKTTRSLTEFSVGKKRPPYFYNGG